MNPQKQLRKKNVLPTQLTLNLAIVGGGQTCDFFLDLIKKESFPFLQIKILGVCDINPNAQGLRKAQAEGIYTTTNYLDILEIKGLDAIIELTNSTKVLMEILRRRPKGLSVIEHNIGGLLKSYFKLNQKLKSTEKQLALEKSVSSFLMQMTNERIVLINTDFIITEITGAFLGKLNKTKEQVIGQYCHKAIYGIDVKCPDYYTDIRCPMQDTLETGESGHAIHVSPFPASRETYLNIDTYPIHNSNGEVVEVIELWRNITDEMSLRLEKRVNAIKSDLNQLVQEDRMISLGKLVASCVHEINNPMQGLLTFSYLMQDILKQDQLGARDVRDFKKYTTLMTAELERCGKIIAGLLSFARESPMENSTIVLNEVVSAVLTLTAHKMELWDIELVRDITPEPLLIHGDANQLQQCFLNLIFNAIEAIRNGGRIKISLQKDAQRGWARFEIHDTGYGIRAEDQTYIFDPFFTTKPIGEGTGLGLSIVYGIVKKHGGDIVFESNIDKGSVFTLRFPTQLTQTQETR